MNKLELQDLKIGMEVKVKKTEEKFVVTAINNESDEDIVCGNVSFKHAALEFLGTYPVKKEKETKEILDENCIAKIGRIKLFKETIEELPENFKSPNTKAIKPNKNGLIPMFVKKVDGDKTAFLAITQDKEAVKIVTSNLISAKRAWNSFVLNKES